MLTQIQTQPYPLYKDTEGTFWMSKQDLTQVLRYKDKNTIHCIIQKHPSESQSKQLSGFYSLHSVLTICQYSTHWGPAAKLSAYISQFIQEQIPPEPKLKIIGRFYDNITHEGGPIYMNV